MKIYKVVTLVRYEQVIEAESDDEAKDFGFCWELMTYTGVEDIEVNLYEGDEY